VGENGKPKRQTAKKSSQTVKTLKAKQNKSTKLKVLTRKILLNKPLDQTNV
jgi:hypothetical protein